MRKINYFIFPIVLVLFIFLSAFTIPSTKAIATSSNIFNDNSFLVDGIYYNDTDDTYMWVLSEDIPVDTLITIISLETTLYSDKILYDSTDLLESYLYSGDIIQVDTNSPYFISWWGEYYTDISQFENLYFYVIQGGINIPPFNLTGNATITLLQLKIEDTGLTIPIYSIERIREITNLATQIEEDFFDNIKIFNLAWYEIEGGPSDTQYYDLVVEIEPGVYDEINAVIIGEIDTLNPYGVIIFQYPRSLSSQLDQKTITFYPLSGSPIHYNNIDYMVVKKFSNKLELYINDDTYLYQPYDTIITGFRMEYIADWDYQDGYNDGYIKGYQEGREKGYEAGRETGYQKGYDDGYDDGKIAGDELKYERGYQKGYDDGYQDGYNDGINTNDDYMLGYNDGFKDGEKSKIAQNNEAFYKSIEKWLVPAIITVIIVGGIVSIIAIKRREQ